MVGWRWAADPMKEERRELRAALVFIVPYVQLECRNAHLLVGGFKYYTRNTYKTSRETCLFASLYTYFDPTRRELRP